MIDLGTLGGSLSVGRGINNAGQVAGYSNTSPGAYHAFLYSNGQMMDLNDLIDAPGISLTSATAINDRGQIVANGTSSQIPALAAFLLTPIPEPGTWALLGLPLLVLLVGRGRLLPS